VFIFYADIDSPYLFISSPYIIIPLLMYAGARHRLPGAIIYNSILFILAVYYTLEGFGPFSVIGQTTHVNALNLQIFLLIGASVSYLSAAAFNEKDEVIVELNRSEKRHYRSIMYAPFPMMLHASDGEILSINQVWTEITGYAHSDIPTLSEWTHNAFDEEKQDAVLSRYEDEAGDRTHEGEFEIRTKNGNTRLWDFYSTPLGLGEDGRSMVLSMAVDITQRKHAAEELRKSEETFKAIVEHVPTMICSFDENGKAAIWNNALTESCGYTFEDAKSFNVFEKFYPDKPKELELAYASLAKKAGKFNEFHPVSKDGKPLVHEWASVGLTDGRTVSVGRDITEQKKLEFQLIQSQKMEAIGTLAGGIAHDFNNILTPILCYVELVQMKLDSNSKEIEYLGSIRLAVTRAKEFVQQILLISRKTQSETQAKTQAVQLKNLVEEVLTLLRSSIPTTIEIRQDFDFNLPPISADPSQIHQVVLNLCTNATQAMPEGGDLKIKLHQVKQPPSVKDQQDNWVCLSVQDDGCGMEATTIEHIYEPFFTTKEKGEQRGTGLGLSIVASIIKQHKGHMEVESHIGIGTTFRVYFPVLTIDKAQKAPGEVVSAVVSGNQHILLVDDDQMVNYCGTEFLKTLGYQVTSCLDSQKALEVFEANPQTFQMLITDHTMPNLTGPQLMKKIKAIRSDIPMLLITGYSNLATPENLKEWGCDGIIAKPYDVKNLSQIVSQALAKAKS
jgi:PAS domain S-box-containing protein